MSCSLVSVLFLARLVYLHLSVLTGYNRCVFFIYLFDAASAGQPRYKILDTPRIRAAPPRRQATHALNQALCIASTKEDGLHSAELWLDIVGKMSTRSSGPGARSAHIRG